MINSLSPIKKSMFAFLAVLVVVLVYSNHFYNPFEFDDEHTIVSNAAIRSLKNIPQFFVDATTTSSLPKNQAYRPGLTTLNTIDYAIGGQALPNPFYYHLSIFCCLLLLGYCLFCFAKQLLKPCTNAVSNFLWALFLSTFFCVHTANSQTINYIIARADSFSTLMVLISFLMYLKSGYWRRYFLYLIPLVIGFSVKEPAIMFVPLLMVYQLLFEERKAIDKHPFHFSNVVVVLKRNVWPLAVIIFLFLFSQRMTPKTWDSGNTDRWSYLISQPFVIIHYFNNFFLPFNLVIDTDWEFLKTITDDRFLIGMGFLIGLGYIIYRSSQQHPLLAFGLAWFLLALAPTSSIIPLSEVLNDHRPFFAYIGLSIALVYGFIWLHQTYANRFSLTKFYSVALPVCIALHGYGTYQQNKIWSSGESVWKEATLKSPRNGRNWMNYGNALMQRAAFAEAEAAFTQASLQWPDYSYLYINTGILKSATNRPAEAEVDFLKAKSLDSQNPEWYVYYAKHLLKNKRYGEALKTVNDGLLLSPAHAGLAVLKPEVELNANHPEDINTIKLEAAIKNAKANVSPENYIELSLAYYNVGQFEACIEACQQSLRLKPDYALAYNNMCSAYNQLKQWDKAIEAGQKGLRIDPTNELLKGNLNLALTSKGK